MLGAEFLGFKSPLLWVYFSVVAGLLAASPLMAFASKTTKPGAVAAFPILYLVIMAVLGEVSQGIVAIFFVIICCAAELVRKLVRSEKQMGLRLGYAVSAVAHGMFLLPLWTKTEWYYEGAIEEMGSQAYADALMKYATPLGLIAQIVLTFAAGYIGAIIAEKLFGDKVRVTA